MKKFCLIKVNILLVLFCFGNEVYSQIHTCGVSEAPFPIQKSYLKSTTNVNEVKTIKIITTDRVKIEVCCKNLGYIGVEE